MSSLTLALILAAITASIDRAGQTQPARDVRDVAHGTAVVTGVVVAEDAEARPVRHARVTLTGAEPFDGMTTVTDDRGRFAFAGLPAGRFELAASKDGWVTSAYGAKRPLRPGTSLPVAEGQKIDVTVRLVRGAVITGVLLDNTGQPSVGTTVRAMRYTAIDGERRLRPSRASVTTDDRGVYRIYGLAPGDYVVGATWRPSYFGSRGSELRLTTDLDIRDARSTGISRTPPPDRTVALAPTFYPGTTVPVQAATLSIRAGEERSGVDFTLQVVPTARVDGTVVAPASPRGAAGVQVSLMATGQMLFPGTPFDGYRAAGADTDGAFAFSDVSPGQYTLLARAALPGLNGAPQIMWASSDLSIDGDSISGVPLVMAPGMTVAGRIRFVGTTKRPADLSSIRIALQPVQSGDAVTIVPAGATVDADGRFALSGVTPGRYRLTATLPGRARWALRSAIAAGVETLDAPLVLQPNQNITDAAITFVDRPAQLSGRLVNGSGAASNEYTIIVFPADPSLWTPQSRRIQSIRPSADGSYAFDNVLPGTYLLGAVDDVETGEWYDPAFLQQLVGPSMKVSIGEGERRVQNVRVGR